MNENGPALSHPAWNAGRDSGDLTADRRKSRDHPRSAGPRTLDHALKPLVQDCGIVLSAVASVSSSEAGEVELAFSTGAPYLRAEAGVVQLLPREECGLAQLDSALDRLALAAPQIKKRLIEACVHVVHADGLMQEQEAELLRAIAETLDCPIPPFVQPTESQNEGSYESDRRDQFSSQAARS